LRQLAFLFTKTVALQRIRGSAMIRYTLLTYLLTCGCLPVPNQSVHLLCVDYQLLSYWKTSLSDRCMRSSVRGRAGVLGSWLEPGWTVLLDDVHHSPRHTWYAQHHRPPRPRLRETHQGRPHQHQTHQGTKPTKEDLIKKCGYGEVLENGQLSFWQSVKANVWALFEEPNSSLVAKVRTPVSTTAKVHQPRFTCLDACTSVQGVL